MIRGTGQQYFFRNVKFDADTVIILRLIVHAEVVRLVQMPARIIHDDGETACYGTRL